MVLLSEAEAELRETPPFRIGAHSPSLDEQPPTVRLDDGPEARPAADEAGVRLLEGPPGLGPVPVPDNGAAAAALAEFKPPSASPLPPDRPKAYTVTQV